MKIISKFISKIIPKPEPPPVVKQEPPELHPNNKLKPNWDSKSGKFIGWSKD